MMRRTIARQAFIVALTLGCFAFITGTASSQVLPRVFRVNTTSDTVVANACSTGSAGCSLRGAITASNPDGDAIIQFNIPASDPFCTAGVCTINIGSALPALFGPNTAILGPGAARLIVKPTTGLAVPVFLANNPSGSPNRISGITVSNGVGSPGIAGGISKYGTGTLDVVDVVVTGNRGMTTTGILAVNGTLNVIRSTIVNNEATQGFAGGLYIDQGVVCNIVNSTITQNRASGCCGGIANTGTLNITNSTVSANIAGSGGGGLHNSSTATASIKNTIVALNTGANSPDVNGAFVSAGFNLIGKIDGASGFTAGTDLRGTIASPLDPRLDPAGLQNNGGATPTIALLANSPAVDKGTSSGLTGVLTTDQRFGFPRTRDNPLSANAAGGNGTDIGAYERNTASTFDFDGDVKTDIGIFRPSAGQWWINRSSTGATFAASFGVGTDKMVPGDFTGDGKTDIGVWRPSTGSWFILRSEDFSFYGFPFGTNGDVPAPTDYDNDGRADAAVFRPSTSTWFILRSTGGVHIQQFGANGDVPVANDYDGDGRADLAIYRPSNGQWWLNRSALGVIAVTFGTAADKPVPGDYTGDGKVDVAIWRPATGEWFVLRSENFSFFSFPFGLNGDLPSPGDYDGDGRVDATVFRPSTATWFSNRTSAGVLIQQFGLSADRPVAGAFVP